MNAGTRRIVLAAATLLTLVAAWYAPEAGSAIESTSRRVGPGIDQPVPLARQRRADVPVPDVLAIRPRTLAPEDEAGDGDLFRAPGRVAAAAVPTPLPAPAPVPEPSLPALPFRVLGSFEQDGRIAVFLQQNERTHVVRAGDIIDDQYRVESVGEEIALRYLPLDRLQTLALGRSLKGK
jgi:hypothetical protein